MEIDRIGELYLLDFPGYSLFGLACLLGLIFHGELSAMGQNYCLIYHTLLSPRFLGKSVGLGSPDLIPIGTL